MGSLSTDTGEGCHHHNLFILSRLKIKTSDRSGTDAASALRSDRCRI